MGFRPGEQQAQMSRGSGEGRMGCLGGVLFVMLVVTIIQLGYYRQYPCWIILGLIVIGLLVRFGVNFRRRGVRWQRRTALWASVSAQSFALTLDEAWQQLLPLLADSSLFSTAPAAGGRDHFDGYPSSLRELFSRYETICI